jgi:hypothetical protein
LIGANAVVARYGDYEDLRTGEREQVKTPELALKGFSRIRLQPGEIRIVTFLVPQRELALVERREQAGSGSRSLYRFGWRTFPSQSEHRVQSAAMMASVAAATVQSINSFRNDASRVR